MWLLAKGKQLSTTFFLLIKEISYIFIKKGYMFRQQMPSKAIPYKNINRGTYSTLKSLDFCKGK